MAPTALEVKTVKSLADQGIKDLPVNYVKDEDERPVVAYNDFSKEVPVISMGKARAGEAERAQLVTELRGACEEWGLFQIIDHGVPAELNSQIMSSAEEFFSLPVDDKVHYAIQPGQFVGYGNGSFINDDPFKDWRELYVTTCSHALDMDHWSQKPIQIREALAQYSDAMMKLAKTLLGLISESLGVEAVAIEKSCGEAEQKVLLNYYPTCPRPDLTLGLKRHTDPGTLTILLQDKVGGLQATKDDGKTWVTVEPIDGAYVVNLGDQMHVLSNGIFKSADHQAVVNSNDLRKSIVTFYNPHPDSIVYPLDGLMTNDGEGPAGSRFERYVYREFYQKKMIQHLHDKEIKRSKGIVLMQQPKE